MGAFQNKVQDMVGSTYSVTAEDELFEAAVHEVADILPTEFLLKNATTPINITTSAGTDVKDSKVLFVERGSVPADLIEYSDVVVAFIPKGITSKGTNSALKEAVKNEKKFVIIN